MHSRILQFLILSSSLRSLLGDGGMNPVTKKIICRTISKNQNSTDIYQCEPIRIQEWQRRDKEYSPNLLCKTNNSISYRWPHYNTSAHLSNVAEIKIRDSSWTYPDQNLNHDTLTIKNLKPHTSYSVRMWVILSNFLVIGPIEAQSTTTSPNGLKALPVPEKSVKIIDYNCRENNCDALVEWAPAKDFSCYYTIVCFGPSTVHRDVDNPATLFLFNVENLDFSGEYPLQITAKQSPDSDSESAPTKYTIRVPTCLEIFANLSICPPSKPEGVSVDAIPAARSFEFNFKITWLKPKLQPDLYEVIIIPLEDTASLRMNVSGESSSASFHNVKVQHMYTLVIKALSTAGWSPVIYFQGEVTYPESSPLNFPVIIIGAFVLLCIVLSLAAFIYRHLTKQRKDGDRRQYFLELEQNGTINMKTMIVDYAMHGYVADEWEINFDDLLLEDVLGHGAFGIVKHGWVTKGNTRTEAAVKMLKNSSTVEEIQQFLQEIEIMKTVGKHPHLVSLVGCCVSSDLGPLLVSEFCARGDLQTYLRNIWEKLSNSSAPTSTSTGITSCETGKNARHFTNKLYHIDEGDQEGEFLLKDFISIARQVAMGMEYLCTLKVLHRDLAARNVLLCEDKTAKVSDFGLSRDVYNNNVYCKMAGGRLPIRWMAIESLTHQRYTVHSDVWSFGILLWEIVSLGATPYPEIENESLLKLLKSGYRMERPLNCPQDIYSIMQLCWKPVSKDRPSFLEIRKMLETVLESGVDYLDLNMHSYTGSNLDDVKKPKDEFQTQIVRPERYL